MTIPEDAVEKALDALKEFWRLDPLATSDASIQCLRAALYAHEAARPAVPRLDTLKGVSYFAKDSDGQWHYINHAWTWQTCPPPFSAGPADVEALCREAGTFLDERWAGSDGQELIKRLRNALRTASPSRSPDFDFAAFLDREREWSLRTFGPGPRSVGLVAHIRKELDEISAAPADLEEWIDVINLALDGAWREGHLPDAVIAGLEAKQVKNENREWPDWRAIPEGEPVEHVRPPSDATHKDAGP